jgi:hypothetical protein
MLYRAVDSCYLDRYPPGQVEMGVYTKDADTPAAWVQKHSDPDCGVVGSKAFIFGVSNLTSVTVAGHDGTSFDQKWSGCGGPAGKGQATAFFLSSKYVFMLGWWTASADYAPTMQAIASQMLATFKG